MFRNRRDAGHKLAIALAEYRGAADTIVVALPRGGVVVGAEVAHALHLPLDIVVPRKIGAPGNEEYAIGALCENGEPVWDTQAVHLTDASEEYCAAAVQRERAEAQRRLALYRTDRPPRDVRGKHVILVDDGIATGMTIRAALATLRAEGATRITVAAPVAASDFSPSRAKRDPDASGDEGEADGVWYGLKIGNRKSPPKADSPLAKKIGNSVILHSPPDFAAVGQYYASFEQTTDDEVIALLRNEPHERH